MSNPTRTKDSYRYILLSEYSCYTYQGEEIKINDGDYTKCVLINVANIDIIEIVYDKDSKDSNQRKGLQNKIETMPAEIRDIIIQLVSENRPESANSFMEQYIRLSPNNIEDIRWKHLRFRVNNLRLAGKRYKESKYNKL